MYENLGVSPDGHLTAGGLDVTELAKKYGTPLYLIDEDAVRTQCRMYRSAVRAFGEGATALYASKALSFKEIYRVIGEEGLGVDCVSCGEIYTAVSAGFPAERIFFHGNNKTPDDLKFALDHGVGRIVVDGTSELYALDAEASARGIRQKILLRITPGIDPHTHKAITTGVIDSKFGSAIVTGQAMEIVKAALGCKNIQLTGLHCHIGSQIFEAQPFLDTADAMTKFISEIKAETGAEISELNLGGGFGVKYTEHDRELNIPEVISAVAGRLRADCAELGINMPVIFIEPGRSIVAAAGVTLYTVGSVKTIPGYRTYISVDGGMPDNPRYALYGSQYTVLIANKADQPKEIKATVAGRCCESGDLIGENMEIQQTEPGDILAVLTTGAYNYSMASNYNRIPRPPVIMIKDGRTRVAVKRETFEDVTRLDL